jgi:hypothetical protein
MLARASLSGQVSQTRFLSVGSGGLRKVPLLRFAARIDDAPGGTDLRLLGLLLVATGVCERGGRDGRGDGDGSGTLTLLEALSEGPASKRRLLETLREAGIYRNERTIRRWLGVFRESGFDF